MLCAAAPAPAQVTVDLQALDAVQGAKPAAKAPPPRSTGKPAPRRATAARPKPPTPPIPPSETPASTPSVATAAPIPPAAPTPPSPAPANAVPPAATLPTAPPPTVALAPVAPVLPNQPTVPPPPPPPISETAVSAASATTGGLRVTFGAGQTDLSPASASAIKSVVQSAPPGDNTSFNVVAYAAGTPEDPSTARRLSLARALAVRSALMADGVSSARIYVRALGAAGGDEAPDRVDLAVLGGNTAAADGAKSQSR
jgi:outer membrane protein OmpA-like peptidoglycan-associated protein